MSSFFSEKRVDKFIHSQKRLKNGALIIVLFHYNNNNGSFKKWSLIGPAVFDALSNKQTKKSDFIQQCG